MIAQDNGTSKGASSLKWKYGQNSIKVGVKSYVMDGDDRKHALQGEERITITPDDFPEGKFEEWYSLISDAVDAKLIALSEIVEEEDA